MARTRPIRNQRKRDKSKLVDLDITSLLDILVILLVFLLKSYNTSGVNIDIPKDITLPSSQSEDLNTPGVMIQVSTEKIYIDSKVIADVNNKTASGKKIDLTKLFDELVKHREKITAIAKQLPEAKPFSGVANLIVDQSTKFNLVKDIMHTCAEAGFKKYKFVVLSKNQN